MEENKDKTLELKEAADKLSKALYKAILKSFKSKLKTKNKIVRDILDPNYVAEINPSAIPPSGSKVLYKKCGKHIELQGKKGIDKLKNFIRKREEY